MDSFNAAVHNSKALSNVEKFNYLRTFLEGETQHISGLSLINDNYNEVLNLLKNRFTNNQVISAHMNTLVKLPSVNNEDVKALQKFHDDAESHVRSLSTLSLGIEMENYGALISTLILEKSSPEVKLVITRNINENTWDLAKVLELINLELRARETCAVPQKTEVCKNSANFDSELLYTGSSLHSGSHRSRFQSGNPSKSGGTLNAFFVVVITGQTLCHIRF